MEKIKNTPSLRFPEFEGIWKVTKLGEVMNFKVTNSFSRENLNYENGNVKNIHYGDIHTKFQTLFDITKESVPFISKEISIGRISEDFYCKEGDIVFADASEDLNDVGKSIEIINLNNEKLLSGLHTLLARPIENTFEIGFNGYLFKSNTVRLQIQKESQGSKVLSVNVGRVSGIEISFPTLKEQQKISQFLTAVDDKLQALKKKKTLLEQYKKGVMQKIFSQELRFKDDNENEYPDWEEKKLSEVLSIQGGFAFKSSSFKANGKTKVLRIGDIVPKIKLNLFNGVNSDEIPNEKYIVKKNDFMMALSGATFGKVGKIVSDGVAYINQRVATFRTNQNLEFFFQLVQSEDFKSYITSIPTASAQPNISNDDIGSFICYIPCFEEQAKIANFLSAIDDKITHCQEQIVNTEVWKKGLLQQMFC
jgi:type I restriction enzyme S subunit